MSANNTRVASVARDPVTLTFLANWSDEEDRHEEGPEFVTVDDAIQWARERAPVVFVMLGFSSPVWFSAGERYDDGREDPDDDPLSEWPPPQELLAKLLADTHVPTVRFRQVDVVLEEDNEQ